MARRITPLSQSTTRTTTGTIVSAVDYGDKPPRTVRGYVKAASVTTGGTVQLQVSADNTNWASAGSATANANGGWAIVADGPGRYWRLQLTARTDGTFSDGYIEAAT